MTAEKMTRTSYVTPDTGLPRTGDATRREARVDLEQHALPLARVHAAGLHSWGVATDLRVQAGPAATSVTVTPGTALDAAGRHICLAPGARARLVTGAAPQLVPVTAAGVTVPLAAAPGQHHLTIAWGETFDEEAYANSGFTVFELDHTPVLDLEPTAGFPHDGTTVVLARITVAADGTLAALDPTARRLAGTPTGEVLLHRPVRDTADGTATVGTGPAGRLSAGPDGLELGVPVPGQEIHLGAGGTRRLSLTTDTLLVRGNGGTPTLHLDATGPAPRLGIGLDAGMPPRTALHLPASGLQIGASRAADDNFHWTVDAAGGLDALRLSNGDAGAPTGQLLTITPSGECGIGTARPTARLTVTGGGAHVNGVAVGAGVPGVGYDYEYETVGVTDPRWNLRLQSPGVLAFHTGGTPPPARMTLDAAGNLSVSGSGHIGGDLSVHSGLDLAGDLRLQAGRTITGTGRLHISGGELLYILNRSGAVIGKEWGGTGSLRVQGDVRIDGMLATNGMEPFQTETWGGGVHCWDLYAQGTIGVGPAGGPPKAWLRNDGLVSASIKRFLIPHPVDPGRHLAHASLEGPETAVYYRGEAVLGDGEVVVELPAYFEALTRAEGRTVCLTPVLDEDGGACPLAASPVRDGAFRIRALGAAAPGQRCYWGGKAVRADVKILDAEPPPGAGGAALAIPADEPGRPTGGTR